MSDEWVVEKILKKRKTKTKEIEYFIKWAEWGDEHNSWVEKSELEEIAQDEIIVFENSQKTPDKPKQQQPSLREAQAIRNERPRDRQPTQRGQSVYSTDIISIEGDDITLVDLEVQRAIERQFEIEKAEKLKHEMEEKAQKSTLSNSRRLLHSSGQFRKQAPKDEKDEKDDKDEKEEKNEKDEKEEEQDKKSLKKKRDEDDEDEDSSDSSDWEWEEFVSPYEEDLPKIISTQKEEEELTNSQKIQRARKGIKKQTYYCNEEADRLRSAIVVVLGHVDTGKTTLLDQLRTSSVAAGEAGGITQQIGATLIPKQHILTRTRKLNEASRFELKLPGLVFIDTPGHESFSNMRVRGSSLCDVAILMVDIMKGLQGQTVESLKLVKKSQTKFIIGLNKVDRINNWIPMPNSSIQEALLRQPPDVKDRFAEYMAKIKKQLVDHGCMATPYWRVKDMSIQIPLIPFSAMDGCGIPDLLLFLMLFSQCMLTKRLLKSTRLKCNVLEVQQVAGMGTTIDVLLVNGELKVGDKIMLSSTNGPITTNIRSIMTASELGELKGADKQMDSSNYCDVATAVQGVKIWARNIENVVAGSSVYVIGPKDDPKVVETIIKSEMDSLRGRVAVSGKGVHVQASTLGSLEALLDFLNESGVPIGSFGLGTLQSVPYRASDNDFSSSVLAFDVKVSNQARHNAALRGIDIIEGNVIYQVVGAFKQKYRNLLAQAKANVAQKPCILELNPKMVVSPYKPIIIGVNILIGTIEPGTILLTLEGVNVGRVETLREAESNVAVSSGMEGLSYIVEIVQNRSDMPHLVFGRDLSEEDRLMSNIDKRAFNNLVLSEMYPPKLLEKYGEFLGYPMPTIQPGRQVGRRG